VSSLFFLSLREFAANSFLNLLIAIALVVYSIINYPGVIELWQILGYIGLIFCGLILYWCMHMFFLLSVFWTGSPRGWGDLFFAASHVMERPDRIFKGSIRFIFTFILPFSVMASYPARFLLEKFDIFIPITLISLTIIFFLILLFIWKRGLRVYSSASS
jgi:ABC-2 type transport system permease protein